MTTIEKPKQKRAMLPTRTSRAFKPLREVLEELENGQPLIKRRETAITDQINALVTYATYQSEKEKSGEDMTLERLKDSRDQMQELTDKIAKISKTMPVIAPVVQSAQSISNLLSDTCKRLEKRTAVEKPSPVSNSAPTVAPMSKTVHVERTKDGGWQIGNVVTHDQSLAFDLIERWAG